jgi:hypothetical protein
MPAVNLDSGDATEFGEMPQFLHDWLAADDDRLSDSLGGFVGNGAYPTVALRADLNGFTFLLGDDNGDLLFAPGTQ